MEASFRERRRLIGLVFEGDPPSHHFPEAVQDIQSRHVRSHYVSSQLIRFSSRAADALHSQQQQHLLTLRCPP